MMAMSSQGSNDNPTLWSPRIGIMNYGMNQLYLDWLIKPPQNGHLDSILLDVIVCPFMHVHVATNVDWL